MAPRPIHEIETKWQKQWEDEGVYRAEDPPAKKSGEKFYGLIEFPYPSGDGLHVGHPRSFTAIDILTRKKRMEGRNVLYPIGWDAFGLPTENYAIKNKVKPQDATARNVANFTRQLKSLGLGFDWSREVNTTDPAYYKWTQWQFLQFFKHGLAYKAKTTINWCPKDKIGLANEEVIAGCCERCGTPVEKRVKEQWMIAITRYADRLLSDLDSVDYLPQIKKQQQDWIGKSEGAYVDFVIASEAKQSPSAPRKDSIRVFTTRPDTLFGATFLVISPELAKSWMDAGWQASTEVREYVAASVLKAEADRMAEGKEKTGVAIGIQAIHPVTGEKIPVWVADYVVGGYGTGAIMAVPAHDERDFAFAKKFGLEIKYVVAPWKMTDFKVEGPTVYAQDYLLNEDYTLKNNEKLTKVLVKRGEVQLQYGYLINSEQFTGRDSLEAQKDIISWLEKKKVGERAVTYKLRDWVFSRQRYWGEPIPIIHCPKDGFVPVPDKDLPVTLPPVEAYEPTDTGESPLAKIREWVEVECPKCGGKAERETDTMPNWAGSSWYFLRYCDPHNDKKFADAKKLKYWMPVDLYNGGMEHTTLHLLYSRFWYKFLWDIGAVPKECGSEPYKVRRSHGLILAEGGEKMSKSKGNVVNPDDVVSRYGADVFRIYEMFMGPFDQPVPWDTNGIEGVKRFLDKVWDLFTANRVTRPAFREAPGDPMTMKIDPEVFYHQTIKKITDGIDALQFNTCVSQMMILVNAYQAAGGIPDEHRDGFLKILAPFAPHLTEELWHLAGHQETIHRSEWPSYDPKKIVAATFELVVQVNGKVRDRLTVSSDISEDEAKAAALASEKVHANLSGKKPKQVVYVKGRLINIVV